MTYKINVKINTKRKDAVQHYTQKSLNSISAHYATQLDENTIIGSYS